MRAFHFRRNRADGVERRRRAHGDLDRLQAACDQSARQMHGGSGVIHDQHRHDRLELEDGEQFFGVLGQDEPPCAFETIEIPSTD
ncbi:hypothetical protein D3C86_1617610 [compost metagenome]